MKQVADLRGSLVKKKVWCFWLGGGNSLMHTMLFPKIFLFRSVGHFGPENENHINGFHEKIVIWGKWAILGLKMACLHNSRSVLIICFYFCTMKWVKEHIQIALIAHCINWTFWAWKRHILVTLDLLQRFFKNFQQWKGSTDT